jgi:hypothetical protein
MSHPSTIRDKEALPAGCLVPVPEVAWQDEGDILGVDGVAARMLDRDQVEGALAAFAVLAVLTLLANSEGLVTVQGRWLLK